MGAMLGMLAGAAAALSAASPPAGAVRLPAARQRGAVAVEESLARRRSCRSFSAAPLALSEISQILWAAQGRTGAEGGRTAPSAGALYPIEIYLAAGRVTGISSGLYRYESAGHRLLPVAPGDFRRAIAAAAHGQAWVAAAPAIVLVAGVEARTARKYGARASRYIAIEAGCVAQNVALEAVALDLGTVVVGAFDDRRLATAAALPPGQTPLLLMPLGRPPSKAAPVSGR